MTQPITQPMTPGILVTGGAGYIGAHTALALLEEGFEVVVLDNLSNSSSQALDRISRIAGRAAHFVQGDVRDGALLRQVFSQYAINSVLHFAGLKAVAESVQQPLNYFDNNVAGTLTLCQAMQEAQIFQLVFSSSVTVYGQVDHMPITEATPTGRPTHPYGRTKLIIEELLADLVRSEPGWHIAVLRYCNPVGAHKSGLIGEDPRGIPNNLLPYIGQVALGKRKELAVFGNDYPTPDGTGIRDYIHVIDLADGHLKALNALQRRHGLQIWNLGTGRGYSVLEMVKAFEKASGRPIPYRIAPRRLGDIAQCWVDPSNAFEHLGWKAERDLAEIMDDAWRWQSQNDQ